MRSGLNDNLRTLLTCAVLTCAVLVVSARAKDETSSEGEKASAAAARPTATHKQVRVIKPLHDGKPITLNTFCLDAAGNILACVGGTSQEFVAAANGSMTVRKVEHPKLVQVYSTDGDLLREIPISFKPTAINTAPDGTIFVAGLGEMAHMTAEGKVLAKAATPQIGDMEEFKKKITEDARKQMDMFVEQASTQLDQVREQIARIEGIAEADRTKAHQAQLKVYQAREQSLETQCESLKSTAISFFSPEAMLEQKLGVTAIAVTARDVFVTCNAVQGHGYSVWRTDHEFQNPEEIIASVPGCCGQMDIQASEDRLFVAENGRFRVRICDRDGEELGAFGKRDRKAADGFGSCCNPMNVRCCRNGDILTAESSIGYIKRFSPDGEFLGLVGKARIGGGCKHVAIGFDEKRDRYYMMNVDKAHVCVLVPLSEAPEFTAEELAAKKAREGLGKKLVGNWTLKGHKPTQASNGTVLGQLVTAITSTEEKEEETPATVVTGFPRMTALSFQKPGELTVTGGMFANTVGEMEWDAVSQDGNTVTVVQLLDGVEFYQMRIEFETDDQIRLSMVYGEQVMSTDTYLRDK